MPFPLFLLRLTIRFAAKIIGVFRFSNRRALESVGTLLKLSRSLPGPELLPCVSIETLVAEETTIEVHSVVSRNGNVSTTELVAICKLMHEKKPNKIFEIGTFDGRTALNMAANAKHAVVYTLDLPATDVGRTKHKIEKGDKFYILKNQSGMRYQGTPYMNNIIQLFGDSGDFDFTRWHRTIDFVFVDGSHSYEYVINDAQIAMDLLRPDGMILFHDYGGWAGVTLALNELFLTNHRFKQLKQIGGTSLVILDLRKALDRTNSIFSTERANGQWDHISAQWIKLKPSKA